MSKGKYTIDYGRDTIGQQVGGAMAAGAVRPTKNQRKRVRELEKNRQRMKARLPPKHKRQLAVSK